MVCALAKERCTAAARLGWRLNHQQEREKTVFTGGRSLYLQATTRPHSFVCSCSAARESRSSQRGQTRATLLFSHTHADCSIAKGVSTCTAPCVHSSVSTVLKRLQRIFLRRNKRSLWRLERALARPVVRAVQCCVHVVFRGALGLRHYRRSREHSYGLGALFF